MVGPWGGREERREKQPFSLGVVHLSASHAFSYSVMELFIVFDSKHYGSEHSSAG